MFKTWTTRLLFVALGATIVLAGAGVSVNVGSISVTFESREESK